jgi:hypothetical protein
MKNMKNKLLKITGLLLISGLLLGTSGCALFRNPTGSWDKATAKVEATQHKVEANERAIADQGKNYVYATKLALQADPSTNKYHKIETQLNDKAVATLGAPSMSEIVELEAMVSNLLSENQKLMEKGQKQLADQDEQVAILQAQNIALQDKLGAAEKKLVDVGTVNAGYASKWTSLVKIFWWIVYGVIAVFVIKILSAVLPPPYNSIVSIVSVPIGLVIKGIQGMIPEAKQAAGVVAKQTYDTTKLTLSHIIEAIEDMKMKEPEKAAALVPYLNNVTSKETTRPVITEVKRELGYV